MSEFKAQCGCAIHVAQWTSKRKIASVRYCETHKAPEEKFKRLETEIAELRKDRERLDWLEANEFSVESHREGEDRSDIWWTVVSRRSKALTHPYPSWRSAVDAAMTEGKGAE